MGEKSADTFRLWLLRLLGAGCLTLAPLATAWMVWQRQGTFNLSASTVETKVASLQNFNAAGESAQQHTKAVREATPVQKQLAAIVLSEAWEGQEAEIRWIYFNLVKEMGADRGFRKSSAFRLKNPWYKSWLYLLGDATYAEEVLPDSKYFQGRTIREFCQTDYMAGPAARRAVQTLELVQEMYEPSTINPYPGWTGQGNIGDFNDDEAYWARSRRYFWLQESGQVDELLVEMLPAGKYTQFIFNGNEIRDFAAEHPDLFPDNVPEFTLTSDPEVTQASK